MRLVLLILFFSVSASSSAQNFQFKGSIQDSSGVSLPSAHIQIWSPKKKVITSDASGEFVVSIPPGEVRVEVSYTGFNKLSQSFVISSDTTLIFQLQGKVEELTEVVISADRTLQSDQFESTRTALTLTGKEVASIPVLGGEADLIKTIQLLPGVSKGVEGSSDLFVRGGAADQNLVLLDGAPVYNTGHLFGFLSVFNPDVLQGIQSVNGAFPAYYGGRLSSILDVTTKSNTLDRTHVSGNVGLLASRLMVSQPIIKDKLNVYVAGRRTYIDQVLKGVGETLPYFFYDLNAKVSFRPSLRDYFEVSYYSGKDVLNYERAPRDSSRNRNITSDFTIANSSKTFLWRRKVNQNLTNELSLYGTRFNYAIQNTFEDNRLFVSSSISDWGGKWKLQWDSLRGASLFVGVEAAHHSVSPNIIDTSGELAELLQSSSSAAQTSLESSAFVQADGTISDRWAWSAGLRVSSASVKGKFYANPEPRLALRYEWTTNTVVKLSYSRMTQYLHRVSSAAIAFPTDIWYPVTRNVRPQTSDQVTLAIQRVIPDRDLFISLEGYYKGMNQLIGYREGTNLFLNTDFESQLIQGAGRAYGLETLIKKEAGKLTGWISYTLSKSLRQYDVINQGEWFFSRYDRRHNAAIVMNYQLKQRWSFSAVFEYISGSRFTPIIGQYIVPSPTLVGVNLIPVYAPLNSVKLANTHRLDLGVKFRSLPNRKIQSEWFVGVYNVYNRATPIGISISANPDGSLRYEQPGLFGFLPFVSYGFKF